MGVVRPTFRKRCQRTRNVSRNDFESCASRIPRPPRGVHGVIRIFAPESERLRLSKWMRGRPSMAFRLNATDAVAVFGPRRFFVTPYGRGQWISMWADGRLNWRLVDGLLEKSYRRVALKRMIFALDGRLSSGGRPGDRGQATFS